MKRILSIFGTRPEAIKMAPVLREFRAEISRGAALEVLTCLTGQHRDLVQGILGLFGLEPDFDLDIMRPGQSLGDITQAVLRGLDPVLERLQPDLVLVHGDTTTSFAAAVAAFYRRIPVAHVEAGLRTHDSHSPFPEEFNRRVIGSVADLHFAPTEQAVENLRLEGCPASRILLTGNTGIDALLQVAGRMSSLPAVDALIGGRPLVLLTAHRRENFGEPLERILTGVRDFFASNPGVDCVYPVHPNPNVVEPARRILSSLRNVHLIPPVGYAEMAYLLNRCRVVMTDSGGLQEEAPALGKPLLVLRESTERPEVVRTGQALLVGSDAGLISDRLASLLATDSIDYARMSRASSPFGDGKASERIVSRAKEFLGLERVEPTLRRVGERERKQVELVS